MADPSSFIGRPITALPTPALVVDPQALERNLQYLARYFRERACKLRPHFKSHKCVTLAHAQLAAGSATGMTCATLAEAEALVAGDLADVLIANQVVGAGKPARLAALNQGALVRAAVDSAGNVADLGAAAREAGVTLGLLVEVDIGMGRCGVPPGPAAVELARRVAETPGLRFDGLQGYEGHAVMRPDPEERRKLVEEAMDLLLATRREVEAAGLPVSIVSSGGTGTYDLTGNTPGVDEVQAGSYALMDAAYRKVRPEFEAARFVLATVISTAGGRAVVDVGTKGLGGEFGPPVVLGHPEGEVRKVAEEHTIIDGLPVKAGDLVKLLPSHGCTTNNLYRRMWIVRGGVLEELWPIQASGGPG